MHRVRYLPHFTRFGLSGHVDRVAAKMNSQISGLRGGGFGHGVLFRGDGFGSCPVSFLDLWFGGFRV